MKSKGIPYHICEIKHIMGECLTPEEIYTNLEGILAGYVFKGEQLNEVGFLFPLSDWIGDMADFIINDLKTPLHSVEDVRFNPTDRAKFIEAFESLEGEAIMLLNPDRNDSLDPFVHEVNDSYFVIISCNPMSEGSVFTLK